MGCYTGRAAVLAAFGLIGVGVGCMAPSDARYVYQDGEFGVIGMPVNSSLGKKDYCNQAHHLMILHFPEGYEIVRAEEVVEGERVLDTARKVELDSEPGVGALTQNLKLGKIARITSLDQKDMVHITESRIIYRRKVGGKSTGPDGFAAVATATPEYYIDPNVEPRKLARELTLVARKGGPAEAGDKKVADARAADPEVHRSSHEATK